MIVHDELKSKKHSTSSHSATSTATGTSGSTKHKPQKTTRYYVVKSGDNLTSIAAKTGVSVTAIEALNRNLDPNALQTGQRLRLRR